MKIFTLSDHKYEALVGQNILFIESQVPDAEYYCLDWGLSEAFQNNNPNRVVAHNLSSFGANFLELFNTFRYVAKFYVQKYSAPQFLLRAICRVELLKRTIFESKLLGKVLLTRFFLEQYGANRTIFLDADAVPMPHLKSALDWDFDLAFTVRPESEWRDGYNNCQIINCGVLFFNTSSPSFFMEAWERKTRETYEFCREQTALTKLLQSCGVNFKSREKQKIVILGEEYWIRVLDCEEFNYNWIENITDPKQLSKIKILHFKGERHNIDNYRTELERIEALL